MWDNAIQYQINNDKWSVWKNYGYEQNEPNVSDGTIINTTIDDYLLFINVTKDWNADDFIHVYHFGTDKLMKSQIVWPRNQGLDCGIDHMMITRDKDKESVLSHGYVKDCYNKDDKFKNVLSMPYYLCELISKWVLVET